jgi:hypothetical protein
MSSSKCLFRETIWFRKNGTVHDAPAIVLQSAVRVLHGVLNKAAASAATPASREQDRDTDDDDDSREIMTMSAMPVGAPCSCFFFCALCVLLSRARMFVPVLYSV